MIGDKLSQLLSDYLEKNPPLKDYIEMNKNLQQELDKYKAKEKELRKYIRNDISEEEFIDTEHYVTILDILDRKDK